ncbi:MAG: hypothetical protein AB7K35_01480 [Pseudorhodoplanes sp.]
MIFAAERAALNAAEEEVRAQFERAGTTPQILSTGNLSTFAREFGYAIRLVANEKEIVFFAALQWAVIGVAYLVWIQVLDWIPDHVWEKVSNSDNEITFGLLNTVLLAWSFLVVAVASYPISLLNAAITAAHYLRSAGERSTMAGCLDLATRHLGRLWVFTTIDAWVTVTAIVDRLPSKRNRRTALDEFLYYAWKIGTIGIVPALVAGKGYAEAAKDSVALLTAKPARTIGIRMGYSLICWIIGVATYLGALAYLMRHPGFDKVNEVYNFYLLMAVPILIAVALTAVLVRPFYLVMVSKLYTDQVPVQRAAVSQPGSRSVDTMAAIFVTLFCFLLVVTVFAEPLGVRAFIEWVAHIDYGRAP